MKRFLSLFFAACMVTVSLTGCGNNEQAKALNDYKTSMETFFEKLEIIDDTINSIDPEAQNAMESLYESFADLESAYFEMSELTVPLEGAPDTFVYIEPLADDAYSYMQQASDYMHDAYSESSYNENVLDAAMECYKRASKRVLYIIDLLHGQIPSDESIKIG